MADLQTIKLLVNTPDRVFYHDDATFVELSTSEGDIGVYPGHIPLTAVVVPCVLSIHNGNDVKKAAVHGGTILAEVAEWSDEIDVERANEARLRAEKRLASHDNSLDMVRADAALKRSLARIKAVN